MLFGSILATPAPLENRAVTDSISSIVNTLEQTVLANTNNISTLVETVKNDVNASVQVVAQINADLAGIRDALAAATGNIVTTTVGGLGGILTSLRGLTDAQIASLTGALNQVAALIRQIRLIITVTSTNLTPDLQAAISDELAAVEGALLPLITPLTIFATAVAAARLGLGVAVTGLKSAVSGLLSVVSGLLAGL